ncbi:F-box domain-containing protein [Mycena kentingensis (nom. inval.)]|nr:F-box domain-containing protein [Mycena kentingensis (nom. inval.)]
MNPAPSSLRNQMAYLDAELATQKQSLDETRRRIKLIKAHKAALQAQLDAVGFPVNSIPVELLARIFRFVRYADGFGQPQCSPQTLRGVCRTWREVAEGSSELWTHLSVNLKAPYIPSMLTMLLLQWFGRAGGRALDFTLIGPSKQGTHLASLEPLFRLYSSQMRRLTLREMGEEDLRVLDQWKVAFPILVEAQVGVSGKETVEGITFLDNAPQLRTYKLGKILLGWQTPWSRLTSFTSLGPMTALHIVNALATFPELVSLDIVLLRENGTGDRPAAPLVHPALQHLHVSASTPADLALFLDAFTLPSLHTLDLGTTPQPEHFAPTLGAFFARSQPPLRAVSFYNPTLPLVSALAQRFPLTRLDLGAPSAQFVADFFRAYAAEPGFLPALHTLGFTIREDISLIPAFARVEHFIRSAPGIRQRWASVGASFAMRVLRVRRVEGDVHFGRFFPDSEIAVFRELKAHGMEVYMDENKYGQCGVRVE